MDILYEQDQIRQDILNINTSLETLYRVTTEREIKQTLLNNNTKTTSAIENTITTSYTGTTEVSLEDIHSNPTIALMVSIESDDNIIVRLFKSIKAFFLSIYKHILKGLKWIGNKIGLVKKEFDDIKKEVDGVQGIPKAPKMKTLRPDDSTRLLRKMPTLYLGTLSMNPQNIEQFIIDLSSITSFLYTFSNLMDEAKTDKFTLKEIINLEVFADIKTYRCFPRIDRMPMYLETKRIEDRANILVPNEPNQRGLKYDYLLPIRIDGDKFNTLYVTPQDHKLEYSRRLGYVKHKISTKHTEQIKANVALPSWTLFRTYVSKRDEINEKDVSKEATKLVKAVSDKFAILIDQLESELVNAKDTDKDRVPKAKEKIVHLREANNTINTLALEITAGYTESLKDLNFYLKIILAQYK